MNFTGKWIDLETITLVEVTQTQEDILKGIYSVISKY